MSDIIENALEEISSKKTNKEKYDVINTTIDEIDKNVYQNAEQLHRDCEELDRILQALFSKKSSLSFNDDNFKLYENSNEINDFYMEYLTLRFEISQLFDLWLEDGESIQWNQDSIYYQILERESNGTINFDQKKVLSHQQQVYEKLGQFKLERQTYKQQLEKKNPTALLSIDPNPTTGNVTLSYQVQLFAWDIHNTFGKKEYTWTEINNTNDKFYEWSETFDPLHGLPIEWNQVKDIDEYINKWTNTMATDALAERNQYNSTSWEKVNKAAFASIIEEKGSGIIFTPNIQREALTQIQEYNDNDNTWYFFRTEKTWISPHLTTFPPYNPNTLKPRASKDEAKQRAHDYLINYMQQTTNHLNWYPKVYGINGQEVRASSQRDYNGNLQWEYKASVDLWNAASGTYIVVVPSPDGKSLISKQIVKISE